MGKNDAQRGTTHFRGRGMGPQTFYQAFSATGALTIICNAPYLTYKLLGFQIVFSAIGTGPSFDLQVQKLDTNALDATAITFGAVTPVAGTLYNCYAAAGEPFSVTSVGSANPTVSDNFKFTFVTQANGVFCALASSPDAGTASLSRVPAIVLAGSASANTGGINWIIEPVSHVPWYGSGQ